jgi:hypothetical protein
MRALGEAEAAQPGDPSGAKKAFQPAHWAVLEPLERRDRGIARRFGCGALLAAVAAERTRLKPLRRRAGY